MNEDNNQERLYIFKDKYSCEQSPKYKTKDNTVQKVETLSAQFL